jgi:hypothetical protein
MMHSLLESAEFLGRKGVDLVLLEGGRLTSWGIHIEQ